MRINLDLKKLGAHGGPGEFFSQLARQCNMGNSCNHERKILHVFAVRGGEEDICQNIFSVRRSCHHTDFFIS